MERKMKVMISGGGTGGHIFPAISIANAIKLRHPNAEILFVGAEDRMEMSRVPEAGYNIVGLPVAGFNRKNIFKNITVLKKLFQSLLMAKKVVKNFQPDVVVGVGGYSSGPVLKIASRAGIPTVIQEQNSYAGVTNKLLAKKVDKICVAYDGMEAFFPKEKIVMTGNPIRQDLISDLSMKDAYDYFNLDSSKKTILVLGGSLGALTLNKSITQNLSILENSGVQILWQCGKRYHHELVVQLSKKTGAASVELYDFLDRMDLAYKVADLVISRAGASSISELCVLGKPAILIPSPNVAEDHQTKNAMSLVNKDAALMVTDGEAPDNLLPLALDIVKDKPKLVTLSENIKRLGQPDAANKIVDEIENLLRNK